MATTSRICRMKYLDKLQISTCDSEDRQIEVTECDDREDMANKLSELATTKDEKIKYIDVWLPVEILRGNVLIVDTPGIGDKDQENVAKMMMDYIPNALAFVFVVNVASAGGLQSDRLVRILERVRGSLNQMHSFDPKDTIFLLNKWDTLSKKQKKLDLFEKMKTKLHEIWKNVEDDCILKFVATDVEYEEVYQRELVQFQQILKSIITKNENKRIKVHIEYLTSFVEDCDVVVTFKKHFARRNAEENLKTFEKLTEILQDAKRKRLEAFENLQQNVDDFLEETTKALHGYIHSPEFKAEILQGVGKYVRIKIGSEIDSRIVKKTCIWQRANIEEMFKRDVMEKITEQFTIIHESLPKITEKMKGFTSPVDVEKKNVSTLVPFFASSAPAVATGVLMTQMVVKHNAARAVAATGRVSGLLFSGLVALDVLDDLDTTIENAYNARVGRLTTEKIKQALTKTYATGLKNIIQSFLEGDLKEKIDNPVKIVASMRKKVDYFQKEESNLICLSSEISKIRNRLKELENTEVKMD